MKMMLWKELRENFKWAVLAMIGLGLAEFYGLTMRTNNYYDVSTLCKASYLMATTFGCAAVGLVLGLIQILPEQRRDQWAALLHRPVPRATIYCGKAVAGLLLYLFATIPPFVATAWYASAPGHFAAPVVPQMLWPGVADTCAGAMYYFAALFVGLRRGAWYGTRAFGFLAALWVSFFVTDIYYTLPRVPIEATLLMCLTLFVAGWGAIMTNGKLSDLRWVSRCAILTVIFYGVCCMGKLAQMGETLFSTQQYYYGTQYRVTNEGLPLKFDYDKTSGPTMTDLTGKIIQDKRLTSGSSYNYVLSFSTLSDYIGDPQHLMKKATKYMFGYRRDESFISIARGNYDTQAERWYYLPIQQEFVGYYFRTNQRIGSIGKNGFRPEYQPVDPLVDLKESSYGQLPAVNQIGQAVYLSEFDQRKLTPVFFEPGVTVFGTTQLNSNQDQNLDWIAVGLLDHVAIIDKTGKLIATLPYHQNTDRWGRIEVAVMPSKDKFFLWYYPSVWIDYTESLKMPSYLEEVDLKGDVLASYTLPPIKQEEGRRTWQDYLVGNLNSPFFFLGNIVYAKIGALCGSERFNDECVSTFGRGWAYTKQKIERICLTSLILAGVAFLWARRVLMPRKRAWLWALFVLGFNLAGLITFRLVADWPVRVNCPECGRKRKVEDEVCPHCHAGWPANKLNGVEIFEEKEIEAATI